MKFDNMEKRLKELILKNAFQYSEVPKFKLSNGSISSFYFNCKQVTLDPEGQVLIGRMIFDMIRYNDKVHAIGGLSLGADPIATAVAYTSWLENRQIQAFIVRKNEKDHGITTTIEGNIRPGDRVIVVDDVITTGESALKAIKTCRAAGLNVLQVIVLVDRQEMNGRENILQEVAYVDALVTKDEIFKLYHKEKNNVI